MTTHHRNTMNHPLRALWDRLLPPGGTDDREAFIPGAGPLRVHWQGYRPEPRSLAVARPEGPGDLSTDGRCWWWSRIGWLLDQPVEGRGPDALWLPYSAIAEPGAEP